LNSKKNRILEVIYNWPTETFIQRHVQALLDVQHQVFAVARHALDISSISASLGGKDGEFRAMVMPNFNHQARLEKFFSLRYLTINGLFSGSVKAISEKVLLGYFERLHPGLIHFHDATLAASMCWIPNELRIPYTLSIRGSDIQVFTLQSPERKREIVSALERSAGVHTVCRDLGRQASELVGREINCSTIYTTVPIPDDLPVWNAPVVGGEIHFVSSGRLMWRKGFANLLIAMRRLRDRGANARLTLIGVGPDLDHLLYLRKMLSLDEFVDFPGKLNYEQIKTVFKTAHAYVQSSVVEGLSNSLAEAMVNGLPVFATDVGGTREVIEDGITGFLLPPLAPEEWAKKLLMVQDAALMTRVLTHAYDRARALFSANRHAREFAAFYRSVGMQ